MKGLEAELFMYIEEKDKGLFERMCERGKMGGDEEWNAGKEGFKGRFGGRK
ncbi:hypothetical protein [Bacillus pumilus]|uniref:hypothetical protein n=1 Tax=Bacillus pumilus TaxID=1408 RepID=UPI0016427400|nr:hypothetical protein [Bacillus pumilus]